MFIEITLERLGTAVAIVTPLAGAGWWFLNHFYLPRAQFFAIRQKDKEEYNSRLKEFEEHSKVSYESLVQQWKASNEELKESLQRLETQHRILAEGPFKAVVGSLESVEATLDNLNRQAELRNEKLLEALRGLDHRVSRVEAVQENLAKHL